MSLVLITGGARSGKSTVAQALAQRLAQGGIVTAVVFGVADGDEEMASRIARHREDRPADWVTLEVDTAGEAVTEWLPRLPAEGVVLVDCLGTLLGGVLLRHSGHGHGSADHESLDPLTLEVCESELAILRDELMRPGRDVVVVTNEVGDGVVPASALGRAFRDLLGRLNRSLACDADGVFLVVCGRVMDLSDARSYVSWPVD